MNFHRVPIATVMHVPSDRPQFYDACTVETSTEGQTARQCNRKVLNGRCSANHECYDPCARYMLRLQVADSTQGAVWLRAFGTDAETVMQGVSAATMSQHYYAKQEGDISAGTCYDELFRRCRYFRFAGRLRSRLETFEGKQRPGVTLECCEALNFVADGREMAAEIFQALKALL